MNTFSKSANSGYKFKFNSNTQEFVESYLKYKCTKTLTLAYISAAYSLSCTYTYSQDALLHKVCKL